MISEEACREKSNVIVSMIVCVWVAPLPEALMVTRVVPSAALDVVMKDRVTVHVGMHGLFVKTGVTPDGSGDVTANATGLLEAPNASVAVIEAEGLVEPWATTTLLGETFDRLKKLTVSDRAVVSVTCPPLALIVTGTVPIPAVVVALNERMTVHVATQGFGFEKMAVTPVGSGDETENVTP